MARAELSARPPLIGQVAQAISGWRYQPQRRDARLDLLRGFAVFVMIADHIGGDSWLFTITGGNQFFISAIASMQPQVLVSMNLMRSLSLIKSMERQHLVQAEHALVLDALRRKDAAGAGSAMRLHLENARNRMFGQ